MSNINTNEIVLEFFGHEPESIVPFGNGHINSTFLVTDGSKKYILQKINTVVFTRPQDVMANIRGVTNHIRKKAAEQGIDPKRATLDFQDFSTGENYF